MAAETQKQKAIYYALLQVAFNHLGLTGCPSGTLAQGIRRLHETTEEVTSSMTMHWTAGNAERMQFHHVHDHRAVRVDVDLGREREWSKTYLVHLRMYIPQVIAAASREEGDLAHFLEATM